MAQGWRQQSCSWGGGGNLGVAEKEQQDHVHPPEKQPLLLLHLDLKVPKEHILIPR